MLVRLQLKRGSRRSSRWARSAGRLTRLPGGVRKRDVLRAGYGAMIALLIVSALYAYRIQVRTSERISKTYHRYIKQTEILSAFHHNFLLGGMYLRDLLLSERADSLAVYRDQVDKLRNESDQAMKELEQLLGSKSSSSTLRSQTRNYWDTLDVVHRWPARKRDALGFEFLQREIAPRRDRAGDTVRAWIAESQNRLSDSEQDLALSQTAASHRLFLMLGLCLLIGLTVASLSLRYAENLEDESARQYEEVEQAKKELEQLSARLLEVQEDERRRLSRELHDEIGQNLTALRIEISHVQALSKSTVPAVRERLERARSLAERSVQSVRDISLLLRPSLLDDLGLGPALQREVEDFTRRTGIPCGFSENGLSEVLPDVIKTCVYRVVQEALNNCQKHSGAKRASVSIRQQQRNLMVHIEDNGKGFELNTKGTPVRAGCLGILGMRERAAVLHGSLSLDASPGKGTRIMLSLPLPETAIPPQQPMHMEVRA